MAAHRKTARACFSFKRSVTEPIRHHLVGSWMPGNKKRLLLRIWGGHGSIRSNLPPLKRISCERCLNGQGAYLAERQVQVLSIFSLQSKKKLLFVWRRCLRKAKDTSWAILQLDVAPVTCPRPRKIADPRESVR